MEAHRGINNRKRKENSSRDRFDIIQAIANMAVVVALVFTVGQYMTTIIPTQQEQRLMKAQALFNSGQFSEAIERYESFLLKDNPIALNNLGYMSERGLDLDKDKEKAKEYYRKAAAAGSEIAINNLIRLDIEEFSTESKAELVSIFRSAYEMKNDKLLKVALSIIDIEIEEDANSLIIEEKYDSLFSNNAEEYANALEKIAKDKDDNKWKYLETYYSTSAEKSYTGSDSKMEYEGAVSGNEVTGASGIYYKYSLYIRNRWNLDGLEFGMEKVYKEK